MLDATLRALARLRTAEAGSLSQGLSPENASACLQQSVRPLNEVSLLAGLEQSGTLPRSLGIVVPYGVFTTPIEWTALAVSAGVRVHLKAPTRDPAMVRTLAQVCMEEGLDVTWGTDNSMPAVDAIVAFGADSTMESIRATYPKVPFVGYGHRFSVAFVAGDPEAAARSLAIDVARYDSRGCMAPTAVFTTGDPQMLGEALALAMAECEARWPRGRIDPALGPEWRRRLGLARVLGRVWTGAKWAVTMLPAAHFVPAALPRMITIHSVQNAEKFDTILSPWRRWLSTCGTDLPGHHPQGFHRVCPLGWMQAPPFPRNHDGRPMLTGLHEA
jgi:hypothetical protein